MSNNKRETIGGDHAARGSKKKGRLIVVSGPSGVGKGTVIERYMAHSSDVRVSVSATTREPRPGEINGVHYYFLSKDKFQSLIDSGGMLEYAEYSGNYYGTPREYVEHNLGLGRDTILEIEVQGAMQIRKTEPDALLIFIMPPSYEALLERLCGRGTDSQEKIRERLVTAEKELMMASEYDFIVVNDLLERTVVEFSNVLLSAERLTRYNKEFIEEVYSSVKTNVDTD